MANGSVACGAADNVEPEWVGLAGGDLDLFDVDWCLGDLDLDLFDVEWCLGDLDLEWDL